VQLVRILDLIGKPIAGLQADLRSRNADGTLMYSHQAENGPRMVRMKCVRVKRENNHKWLRWEWEKSNAIPFDCGFSGIRMDSDQIGEYHLQMEVPDNAQA